MAAPTTTCRPGPGEYAAGFAGYVARIGEHEDILHVLGRQHQDLPARLGGLPPQRGDFRYAPGKWSLKEVLGHLSDTERIYASRALWIARAEPGALPGFNDQAWVAEVGTEQRTLADMTEEWGAVRAATLALFRHLPAACWTRQGLADGKPASVRALAYVIAGHTRHHIEVLEARYLG